MEQLYGYIENIVYTDPEQGFTVARLKEPKKQDLTCIVGSLPSIQPGETISCLGTWKHHPKHGPQFEVHSFETRTPSDLIGIQKYLESGLIKGIGPKYAEKIVQKFELATLDVIDKMPQRLSEVEGIGEKRVEKITSCWQAQKSIRNVMIFLRTYGISPAFAQKIFKRYGEGSIEKVKSNPYTLAKEIHGVGFKSADSLAKALGIPLHSNLRIDAGIEFVLWELSQEGHICYPKKELSSHTSLILEVPEELCQARIEELVRNGLLMQEEEKIFLKMLYLSEVGIARECARLYHSPSSLRDVKVDKALEWVQEKLHIKLAKEQKNAVEQGLCKKLQIITGGPGTGKSTITKAILAITEKLSDKIILAAPTGRAAKRMTEITKKKAFTIHSLLEMDFKQGGFKRNRDNPLQCDLIIIDEASMIDTLLMYSLLKAIPHHARVIFVGDIDQLPSVGPGNVLRDMIASECLPVTRLRVIFRQAKGSKIITNAHRVNNGYFPDMENTEDSDFFFYDKETPEEVLEKILSLVHHDLSRQYKFNRFDDIQVLSPMKKGVIGTENLNHLLQEKLNPHPYPLFTMGKRFHLGDKVMQIRNNYQKKVYNGDIGRIESIDHDEQMLKVVFEGSLVEYEFSELDEIVLAYAVSIHKYQGSECPCIVMPIHTSHFKLLYRNLVYTGITRGKKLVVMIGTKKAVAIAVKNEEVKKRYTDLQSALKRFMQANPAISPEDTEAQLSFSLS